MKKEIKRQIVHISGVLFVVYAVLAGRFISFLTFFSIFVFLITYAEIIKRYKHPVHKFEERIRRFLLGFEREDEKLFEGAYLFFLSFAIVFLLFPLNIASASCLILSIGDSFSTIFGKLIGKHKIYENKTVEGFLVFVLFSYPAASLFVDPIAALVGSLVGAIAELSDKINDNISIPLLSARQNQLVYPFQIICQIQR